MSAHAVCEATATFPGGGSATYYDDYVKNAIFRSLCRAFDVNTKRPLLDADLRFDGTAEHVWNIYNRAAAPPAVEVPAEVTAEVVASLALLRKRPRQVVEAYFGLHGAPEPPAVIAKRLGLPLAAVRKMLADALDAMRAG